MGFFDRFKNKSSKSSQSKQSAQTYTTPVCKPTIRSPYSNGYLPSSADDASFMVPQWLRIVNDCTELINRTKDPTVFSERYDLLLDTLERLAYCEQWITFEGETPSSAFKRVENEYGKHLQDFDSRSGLNLSASLESMEEAVAPHIYNDPYRTNPVICRHFDLNQQIAEAYKRMDYSTCIKYCIEQIQLYPSFKTEYSRELGTLPPSIPGFLTAVKVYEKQSLYDNAIQVCRQAIEYGLSDGTKGGFEGRIKRLEKSKTTLKAESLDLIKKEDPSSAIAAKANEAVADDFPALPWYISVSFGKSSSENFQTAIFLAKNSVKYYETNIEGKTIYQAVFGSDMEQYVNFIRLYELVSGWKSTFVVINGTLVDRKVVQGLNYCYGDKCRSGRSDFCFGASPMTDNPFGCHRLQISACNNPWWSFAVRTANGAAIDKEAIRRRIEEYSTAYRSCPSFDYDFIMRVWAALPDHLTYNEHNQVCESGTFKLNVPTPHLEEHNL